MRTLPAALLADPVRVGAVLDARQGVLGTADRRVTATIWWYSASAVLLQPPLEGLATDRPLSARLTDLTVTIADDGLPLAAASSSRAGDLAGELRTTLAALVTAVAAAGGLRERPLWAIATDSLATILLDLGRARGEVVATTGLAVSLGRAVGAPLPPPRYVDVAGARFVRRASCCLLYRLPGMPLCASCPRRPPAERAALLAAAASGVAR